MPAIQKRNLAHADGSEPKKAKHNGFELVDPMVEKLEVIKQTLADPESAVPGGESHREMLLACIPHTLPVPCDARHEYQNAMAQMVEVVLRDKVTDCETKVSNTQAKVVVAEQQSKQAMKDLEESASRVEAQEEEVAKCQGVLAEDSQAAKASREALEAITQEVADFDTNLQKAIDDQKLTNSLYNECFLHLKMESVDQKTATQLLKKMEPMLKKLGTESSLLSAVAPAIKKSPADRGPFDVMALEGIEAVFTKRLAALQERIDKADVLKAEKVAAQEAAQVALDAAIGKETASEQVLKKAEETKNSLQARHQDMYTKMDCQSEMEAIAEHGISEDKLAKAKQALGTFTELYEQKTIVPPTADETMEKAEDSTMESV